MPIGSRFPSRGSIVEPVDNNFEKQDTLTARSVVSPGENGPERIMNTEQESKVVYLGTTVGQISEVNTIHTMLSDANPHSATMLREDLAEMLQKTMDKLTTPQYKAEAFLLKCTSLFAENNFYLGRTGVVNVNINSGDSRPIEQHPRRVPAHLTEKADIINDMLARDVIKPPNSPWSSHIFTIKKKNGSYRFYVD